jgi:hypothetical protein
MYQDGDDETAGKSSKLTADSHVPTTQLLKPSLAEPTVEVTFSNSHVFFNLDTALTFFRCCGFSAGDMTHEGAKDGRAKRHTIEKPPRKQTISSPWGN